MPFIAPYEQLALEQAFERGVEKGIELCKEEGIKIGRVQISKTILFDILSDRFGEIPTSLIEAVQGIEDLSRLQNLCRYSAKVTSLEEMVRFMEESKSQ